MIVNRHGLISSSNASPGTGLPSAGATYTDGPRLSRRVSKGFQGKRRRAFHSVARLRGEAHFL